MKKALLIASVLFIAVVSTACINNIAVQELNNKAAEFMQKGDYNSAINRLEASIDLDATMYETYYNLGIAATSAKSYPKAIEAFENGLKIKPDSGDFYYSLAVAQSEYADYIKEELSKDSEIEIKTTPLELKDKAIRNLEIYLSSNPNKEYKEVAEELLKSCKNFIDENKTKTAQ